MDDIVRANGYLTLGSRLKRIGERMQADVLRFTEQCGVSVQSGQFPLLAALDRYGPMTVGSLASAVGIAQPGVTRNVIKLTEMGLVEMHRVHRDQRQKTVVLTAEGRRVVEYSRENIWPQIEAAVTALCDGLTGSFLMQLGAIEDQLAETPLDERASALAVKTARTGEP
jgi:DNA-binding MarR family transcriptional regulator